MKVSEETLEEIIEGKTKIVVPKRSLVDVTPPKEPAFFNPKAKTTRDFSIIVYESFLKKFAGPKIFLEGLSGLGARGVRVANELDIDKVIINDLNPNALLLAERSAKLNKVKNIEFSEKEICRFLSEFSKKDQRGTIVDIDPFGSPAPYFDCGIRATMHGGILSVTATDLQVLNGLFNNACKRRYGGVPIRVEFGSEIAIRLILGCLRIVSARLDIQVEPIFVESDMHYYRVYVKIFNRPDQTENLGYIFHCSSCGHRGVTNEIKHNCELCNDSIKSAGPLWIERLFDKNFVKEMITTEMNMKLGKNYVKVLEKCLNESEMPPTFFTVDEIASKMKSSPPKLEEAIKILQQNGFLASPTCFSPTGFRTNARIEQIEKVFSKLTNIAQTDKV